MPVFAGLYLIIVMGSAGLPALSGFVGEFLALLGRAGVEQGHHRGQPGGVGLNQGRVTGLGGEHPGQEAPVGQGRHLVHGERLRQPGPP